MGPACTFHLPSSSQLLRLIEIRTDSAGKQFVALQGQTDEEAHEMGRKYREDRDKMAAAVFQRVIE